MISFGTLFVKFVLFFPYGVHEFLVGFDEDGGDDFVAECRDIWD